MSRLSDAWQILTGSKALTTDAATPTPRIFSAIGAIKRVSNLTAARHSQTYGGTDPIDMVMNCVDLYAQTAAHAEWYFKSPSDKRLVENPRAPGYKGGGYSQAPDDLTALFKNPNRYTDWTEFFQLAIIDYLLTGEFFWLKNEINALNQPLELYRLPPPLMDVVPGKAGPDHYIYRVPGDEPQRLELDEVVHVKRANPHDPFRGLGVIAGNPRLYDIALALDESIAQYYEDGTRLSGVLESERSVPPSTAEKVKREFAGLYSGRRNAFKVGFLERGLTFKPLAANAEQAQFSRGQDDAATRIGRAFKVGPTLMGLPEAVRGTAKEEQRTFDNQVMRPLLDALQDRISAQLTLPGWNVSFCIEYEYVMPIEDRLDLATNLAVLPGIRIREVRDQVGLDPLGDERDEIVLNLPGQNTPGGQNPADRQHPGHPDMNLPGEPGRPPNPGNTQPFPAPGQSLPASADASKALMHMVNQMRKEIRELEARG